MRRSRDENSDSAAGDSFLDIVSNIVGILVILVMVAGARIKNYPASVAAARASGEQEHVAADIAQARLLEHQSRQMIEQSIGIEQMIAAYSQERTRLSTQIALLDEEVRRKDEQLSAAEKARRERIHGITAARIQLGELERRQISAVSTPTETITVKSYPSAISKTAAREEHFRLKNDRIVRVPIEEHKQRLEAERGQLIWKLKDLPEVTGTIAPIDGFRLRYHFIRTPTGGELKEVVFRAVAPNLGEPLEDALAPGSALERRLSTIDPRTTPITIWTYPDSFRAFARLKKHLYDRGYAVAARPVRAGGEIRGSPQGTRSAAQ